jgi:hypothetical protein
MAAKTSLAGKKVRRWTRSRQEWVGSAGWGLVAYQAMRRDGSSDELFEGYLEAIEAGIHQGKNRVRHSMNGALIAIGMRNPKLKKKAIAAARRIGNVEVDHGETSCQTPDAVSYIERAGARRRKRPR